ncbi:MAG: alginate export family protein [Mariprofundus sp.]|nr:alginate export family protein [Mariprofundus sp.]
MLKLTHRALTVLMFLLSPIFAQSATAAPKPTNESVALSPAVEWQAGGSLRLRYEWKQGFALGSPSTFDPQDYLLSQLRLHTKIHHGDQWSLYLEGQDARVNNAFWRNNINDKKAANIFADQFDLHQAFLDISWGDEFASRLRLGRQKFNLGAQRMIASLEWVNTARVWDGIRLTQHLGSKGRQLDLFASQLVPVRPHRFNSHAFTGNRLFDSQLYGAYLSDKEFMSNAQVDFYYLLRRNIHLGDRVQTFGLRYAWLARGWDADSEVMMQTGRYGFLQQQAYAAHIGAGRTILKNIHLGIAYNYASGDSSATDNKHQTFDNLYPLNHAYYGYMDLFSLQNIHNGEVALRWKPYEKTILRLAYQGFWLAKPSTDAWYNAGAGVVRNSATATSSYVGSEIDITASTQLRSFPLTLMLGYSHFFAGSYVAQSGTTSDADFFFSQGKYLF